MTSPALPSTFYWTAEAWGAALRCRALDPVAAHLFTTRQLALSSQDDWMRLARAIDATQIATVTQVHGRDVVVVQSRDGGRTGDGPQPAESAAGAAPGQVVQRFGGADRPEADILVSNDPDVALAVRAADCVPLLLGDPATGAVAAVHAGWRGTAAGAAMSAVEALSREFGSAPGDLIAAIGPSIGACCYEVGFELIDAFLAAGHSRADVDGWFTAPAGAVKPRLDTWAANRDQLQRAGVHADNIHVAALCTSCNLDLFPSFRREKEAAGRLAGAIRATSAG
jgi:polyphenol oxidase